MCSFRSFIVILTDDLCLPRIPKTLLSLFDPCIDNWTFDILLAIRILLILTMSGSVRSCCVPKCGRGRAHSDGTILHCFPHPQKEKERFTTWMHAVGSNISSLPYEYIHKNRKICDDHFEKKFKTWNGRLCKTAVPTLLMPGFQILPNVMRDITNILPAASCDRFDGPSTSTNINIPPSEMAPGSSTVEDIPIDESKDINTTSNAKLVLKSTTAENIPKPQRKGSSFVDDKAILAKMLKKAIKKKENYATRLKKALKLSENNTFQRVMSKFSSIAAIFIAMQFREVGKSKMGRRFTENEKVMALSLYKYGPKLYRFMSKAFVLPSPLTLSRLIARTQLCAGLNEKIFKLLKRKVKHMKPDDRLCVLLFDEMALSAHFDYNPRKDNINGFVYDGKTKEKRIADHALVFMIRGILRNYKQPIAYTFCSGSTKKEHLASLIENIIRKLHSVGLRVLATVCDQGASNVSCINYLINKTRAKNIKENKEMRRAVFEVDNKEVIPLYDPPHLLKGIRNNLLTKDLKYTVDGVRKTAKWDHLVQLHREDPAFKGIRLLKKLTDEHINPERVKMKVKFATQIFSQAVASTMGYLADKKILPEECKQTAELLLFFDELFDTMNGSQENMKKRNKELLNAVKPNSKHNEIWCKSKRVLDSMKFITNGKEVKVPSINNWLHTVNNIEYLRDVLFNEYKIKSIWTRHFNQDPLENFFGCIRSNGYRNVNPTPEGFETAFASLLITNLSGTHSPGYNCEKDTCANMFKTMKSLFKMTIKDSTPQAQEIDLNYMESIGAYEEKKENPQIFAQLQYVSGYLLRKTKENIFHDCVTCRNNFYSRQDYEYINAREYRKNKKSLLYPKEEIIREFSKMQDISIWALKKYCERENLKNFIKTIFYVEIYLKCNTCNEHKNKNLEFMYNLVSNFFIHNWCKDINNILRGRRKGVKDDDVMKQIALDYFNKRKKLLK